MCNQAPFPDVFSGARNGFVTPLFCFVAAGGTKHLRFAEKTLPGGKWFIGLWEIKTGLGKELRPLARLPGAG